MPAFIIGRSCAKQMLSAAQRAGQPIDPGLR
jgi:hypothetical protein